MIDWLIDLGDEETAWQGEHRAGDRQVGLLHPGRDQEVQGHGKDLGQISLFLSPFSIINWIEKKMYKFKKTTILISWEKK